VFVSETLIGCTVICLLVIKWHPVGIVVSSLGYLWMRFLLGEHEYQLFRQWKSTKEPLEALPIANTVDLAREDRCIICRQQMIPGHARRLHCHHCMDLSYLLQWTQVQRRCPLCEADLNGIFSSSAPYLHRFEIPRSLYHGLICRGPGTVAPMIALRKMLDRGEDLLDERRFLARQTDELDDAGEIADNTKLLALFDGNSRGILRGTPNS
jgi:hypothetical protein